MDWGTDTSNPEAAKNTADRCLGKVSPIAQPNRRSLVGYIVERPFWDNYGGDGSGRQCKQWSRRHGNYRTGIKITKKISLIALMRQKKKADAHGSDGLHFLDGRHRRVSERGGDVPDVGGVFGDRAVGREPADPGNIQGGGAASPGGCILRILDLLLRRTRRSEIGRSYGWDRDMADRVRNAANRSRFIGRS